MPNYLANWQVRSMKMDHDWVLAVTSFIAVHIQQLYAFGLAAIIAGLRVIYRGGGWIQTIVEGSLCGLATLTVIPLIAYFGLPENMAQFAGGVIGWVGVTKLSTYLDKLISNKVDK